jgi:hypothetical protein
LFDCLWKSQSLLLTSPSLNHSTVTHTWDSGFSNFWEIVDDMVGQEMHIRQGLPRTRMKCLAKIEFAATSRTILSRGRSCKRSSRHVPLRRTEGGMYRRQDSNMPSVRCRFPRLGSWVIIVVRFMTERTIARKALVRGRGRSGCRIGVWD